MTPPRSLDAVRRDDDAARPARRAGSRRPGEPRGDDLGRAAARRARRRTSTTTYPRRTSTPSPSRRSPPPSRRAAAARAARPAGGDGGARAAAPPPGGRRAPRRRRRRRPGAWCSPARVWLPPSPATRRAPSALRAVSSIIDGVAHRHAAAAARDRARSGELQATERLGRSSTPSVVATLEAEARRLPDQGGPEVQAALARLRQRLQSRDRQAPEVRASRGRTSRTGPGSRRAAATRALRPRALS